MIEIKTKQEIFDSCGFVTLKEFGQNNIEKRFMSEKWVAVDNLIEWINNNTSKIQGVVYNHDGVKYENQSYDTISKKEIIETLSQKQDSTKVKK